MRIGGLQPFSLIDFPGKIAAIVFTQGCSFNCPYCHNPELADTRQFQEQIPEKHVLSFLKERKNKLEGVVITGGEPTLQQGLQEFMQKIKKMGFAIKLDTNGSNPAVLKELVKKGLVDFLAMDIKAPLQKYTQIVKARVNKKNIQKSIDIILGSGLEHEFRTTVVKSQLSKKDIIAIGKMVKGCQQLALQKFSPAKTLDPAFAKKATYSDEDLEELKNKLEEYVKVCIIR